MESGYITLSDDGTLTGTDRLRRISRAWVPLALTRETTDSVCLIGASFHYARLLENLRPGRDPGIGVIIRSLEKAADIPPTEADELKASLMKKYWRPRYLAGEGLDDTGTNW